MAEKWGYVFDGEANVNRWTPRLGTVLAEQRITKLRLDGWRRPDFEPLLPFRDQLVRIFFDIYDDADRPDLAALGKLSALKRLSLDRSAETIDFAGLVSLEQLSVSADHPRFGNLPACRSLRTLSITNCGLRDLMPLAGLDQLVRLEVHEAPLRTLAGIAELRSLRELSLGQVTLDHLDDIHDAPRLEELFLYMPRKLLSIAPVTRLPLRNVSLGGTRRIADLDRLGDLGALEHLELDGVPLPDPTWISRLKRLQTLKLQRVGKLPSLAFLRGLDRLEKFFLLEGTVVEGDLGVLLELAALQWVILHKGRHYAPQPEAIQATLVERGTREPGSFGNTAARRWIADLVAGDAEPRWMLGNTIGHVLHFGAGMVPSFIAQRAIAGAELLAAFRAHRGPTVGLPRDAVQWFERQSYEPPADLIDITRQALDRVVTAPSELLALWEARGQAAAWKAAVADLKSRATS